MLFIINKEKNNKNKRRKYMKIDLNNIKEKATNTINITKEITNKSKDEIVNKTNKIVQKTYEELEISKEKVVETIDQNNDGQLTIEDIIIAAFKVPGIKINREEFLKKELQNHCTTEEIYNAITTTPIQASIPNETIEKIAKSVIQYERLCVSGISTALSLPGGIAMAATLPTDIAQFYGYMLRAAQKLLYLYGFPEIDINDSQILDSATMNTLIICMGVMYGVAGANSALKSMAKALSIGVEKKLINTALTKGTIYPIVKSISKWFNIRMTKEIFAGFFKKSIPVLGGVIGGGITYATFKPCCERLMKTLQETKLYNVEDIKEEYIEI